MVVDGSAVSREIASRIMGEVIEDAAVCACASGAEALQHLDGERFDLITTALLLPDIDGLELCRQLRSSRLHRFTPLIVISGDVDSKLRRDGFAVGVTDYFDKSQGYPAFGKFIKTFCQHNTGLVGRVLYVEDSLTAATFTRRILERHGLQITHVTTAEAAAAILERSAVGGAAAPGDALEQYDLVLTDYHLEGLMSGIDLLQHIRVRYQYGAQELPVLMVTGNDDRPTLAEALHAGANDLIAKPMYDEILMARVNTLLLVKQQYDALQRQAEAMARVAATDALSGVRNRHYLMEHGEALLRRPNSEPYWVMIIDIDHLSRINAEAGHLVGDHILASVGEMLTRLFPDGEAVRFGGEEFAVLLPRVMRKDALRRAEGLRLHAEGLQPDGVGFTVSIGLVGGEDYPSADLNTLLKLADRALDASKGAGRNLVSIMSREGAAEAVTELPRRA